MQSISPSLKAFFFTSVGRKIITAYTGFFLILFLTVHLLGNLTLYGGAELFNLYAYTLTQNAKLLLVMEIGLAAGFLAHIALTTFLSWKNRRARPKQYKNRRTLGMSTLYSSNMGLIGGYLLLFLVVHIRTFRFGEAELVPVVGKPGVLTRDLYTLVVESFSNFWYSLFYVIAMLFLAGHLYHGFGSAFKSLGWYSTRYRKPLHLLSTAFAVLFGLGFATIPIYFYFNQT